jgi:hypothetical protein
VDGELEDILDCLFLLLVDLLAILGLVLLYSIALGLCSIAIALSVCGGAIALHICMAGISISLGSICQLDVGTFPTLSFRLAVCSHASAKLL